LQSLGACRGFARPSSDNRTRSSDFQILGDRLDTAHGELRCSGLPDIVTIHRAVTASKVLIASDIHGQLLRHAQSDVDSLRWIDTLERLLAHRSTLWSKGTTTSTRCALIFLPFAESCSANPHDLLEQAALPKLAAHEPGWDPRGLCGTVVGATCSLESEGTTGKAFRRMN
jgi:hypothetical protein